MHLSNVLFSLSFAPFVIGSILYVRLRVAYSDMDRPRPQWLRPIIPVSLAASIAQLIVAASIR